MHGKLTLGEVARFFVPLIFWAQLMMITHTVIHSWLARQGDPTVAIAGFSLAFALNALLSSVFRPIHQIVLGFITSRRSVRRVWKLGAVMAAANMAVISLVALTPLGDLIYAGFFGAGPRVAAEARGASLVFVLLFPLQMTRNVGAGLLMLHRRTLFITYGTVLRLGSLGVFLLALSFSLAGAQLGAAALVLCIAVESLFVLVFSAPFYRERPEEGDVPLPGYGEILRFAWPLLLNAIMENALVVIVNLFLGRLARPDLALASFGVARGLLMLMMSPLRNMAQTAQALTRTVADLRTVLRFTRLAAGLFTVLIGLVFYTPLQFGLLSTVMGLGPELSGAVGTALLSFAITPFLWAHAAVYRGLLAGARHTGVLATTGLARIAAVGAVSSLCLFWPAAEGALVGVLALTAAYGIEAGMLGRTLHGHVRAGRAYAEKPARA